MNSKFLIGSKPINITIRQQRVFYLCHIRISQEMRDRIPLTEASKIHGDFLLGFSFPPKIGDIFVYEGHEILIMDDPLQHPSRYKSKGKKHPPELNCEVIIDTH
jgi:hypothetical protein